MAEIEEMARATAALRETIDQMKTMIATWETGIETARLTVNGSVRVDNVDAHAVPLHVAGNAHFDGMVDIGDSDQLVDGLIAELKQDTDFLKSVKGQRGPKGPDGIRGVVGKVGKTGPEGTSGDRGPKGNRGRPGKRGKDKNTTAPDVH